MNNRTKYLIALLSLTALLAGAIFTIGVIPGIDERNATLLGFVAILAGAGGLAVSAAALLGPSKPGHTKSAPYECGSPILQETRNLFDVRFFMLALVFILFDIETILLLPYVVQYKAFGVEGLIIAGIFFLGLVESLIYAWKKGALDWN